MTAEDLSLVGVVLRVLYADAEHGFSVVRVESEEEAEFTGVGSLFGVQPGETLSMSGRWVQDPRFGRQFKVESYRTVDPKTKLGIERYLGSGLVEGIGRGLAKRLVEHFGDHTLDVIEKTPERLREVPGIGASRKEKIRAALETQRVLRDVMVFLGSHGISSAYALRIFKLYGRDTIAKVRAAPYRLALDVAGIGFQSADGIARSIGIERDAPERVEAGILHVLGQAADSGHVYLPRDRLLEQAQGLLELPAEPVGAALPRLLLAGLIVGESSVPEVPIYLAALHRAELELASGLIRLLEQPAKPIATSQDELAEIERGLGITLAENQREAVERSGQSSLLVLTGGPGTGKTTVVRGMLQRLRKAGLSVELAAPTGRAARRLEEATRRPARTLHRLLEYSPKERRFLVDEDAPLSADVLIVDESSMIDVFLFGALVRALKPSARLIVVGDADQLPSVGPGAVLSDLLRSPQVPCVRLERIFRQRDASLIIENAHAIRRGELPDLKSEAETNRDFYFIHREEPEQILSTLRTLLTERIPRRFGFDPGSEVQVLTPMNRGLLGTSNLNKEIQTWLNPHGAPVPGAPSPIRVGDKVMQIKNDYELDVFNGDIGRATEVSSEGALSVELDGRTVTYPKTELDALTLAYACSIHKSQGSEFPAVILILHTQHYVMLRRNLVYTAITRGKRLVVVLGSPRALRLAVSNARVELRHSGLAERLLRPAGTIRDGVHSSPR